MVRAVPTVLCCAVLCCAVLCHPAHATHFDRVCPCLAVLNTCVFYVCLSVCQAEVVAGKGQEPVETQNGGMVMYGNSW